uniref:Activin types I and II receptor domain-containing protein n=1 Tax=Trichuris muris TaxID=70415 RepID=A0A5S6QDZ8_TRIMR
MKWSEVALGDRLTRQGLLLFLLLTTFQWPLALTVKCFTCEGLHCVGEICEGRYCLVSSYASVWGQTHFGQATHVKGCINGSLLRRSVKSHCEVYSEGDAAEDIKMCICNADYCNANIGDKVREHVEFVTCQCVGPHCGKNSECVGEYCSYVYDSARKEVHRGCVNRSVPLIERKGQGACMRPPITGATVHSGALHQSTNVETCLCSENYCNERKPKTLRSRKQQRRCRTKARLSWNDFPMETSPGHCYGDHCFKVEMTARQSNTRYQAEGCISFISEKTIVEELSEKGCVEFQSPSLSVKTCFDSQEEVPKRRKEEAEEAEGEEEEEEEEEEKEEDKEVTKGWKKESKQPQKPRPQNIVQETSTESVTGKPEDEGGEEEEDEEEEEGEDEEEEEEEEEDTKKQTGETPPHEGKEEVHKQMAPTAHPSNAVPRAQEEAKTEKEHNEAEDLKDEAEEKREHVNDNTTLVVAFVVIMVIIAVAGLVWKCELHKKIFHSRYQTVAGM